MSMTMTHQYNLDPMVEELEDDSRAPHHSKTPYKSQAYNATQLQFYPPQWAIVLDAVKGNLHCFVATECAFLEWHMHMKSL